MIIDLYGRPVPGSLMQAVSIGKTGTYRIARRDAELYSVQICSAGAWGSAKIFDAEGNDMWFQPSAFTGSFVINGHAVGGLLARIYSNDSFAPNLTINFREVP